MIHYALKCGDGHSFDSWFQSASAFDKLQAAGHIACAVCGSAEVEKALMAPGVAVSATAEPRADAPTPPRPQHPAERALAAYKRHVEANSDYVGRDFAREARAMHDGDAPTRAIWGEARRDEARKLVEDGVPVAPLPFIPTRKTN